MDTVSSIRDLIALWPTRIALLDDLRAACPTLKVTIHQINKWAEKDSIRAQYHFALLKAARTRGLDVSADLIVALHAPERDCAVSYVAERRVA